MSYTVGSLVKARGREWVVLPDSSADLLYLRPLGGIDEEVTGILPALETIEPAQFALPDPREAGDHTSAKLLRDAVRLAFRNSAGPFRSFARINVDPRPYQLVPLLMALKQNPVRLLIGDDVGIGKTVEALLIARELLDRGEITRIGVLCPPQLAEQWQDEMRTKFYINAELVLASTATRLERGLRLGQSLFDHYPFVVISTDFIKSSRRRDEFVRSAPEFIIVDEAHTVAHNTADPRGGRHQRFELVKRLSEKENQHLVLVTATPHSGKEAPFRSLLSLLDKTFLDLPEDLTGAHNQRYRRELARYFVQRRRGDVVQYADEATVFPERLFGEATYTLSRGYRAFFDKVIEYARETVRDPVDNAFQRRVRWWSALALLRSLASSPAAAASTLRNRAASADAETTADADEIGRRMVLDLMGDDTAEGLDVTPGGQIDQHAHDPQRHKRRLLSLAQDADRLRGGDDAKLQEALKLIKGLLKDGYSPIIFCRFIDTVDYLVEQLREGTRGVEVVGITGSLPPAERELRVADLKTHDKRVLVCTDCLSEGINLQDGFDAVMHYDLSWNPTRHEQREGRVDRYGQEKAQVKIVTYHGLDNPIDGIVLNVLLRKHQAIRHSLGISVPIPGDPNQIAEAIIEGVLLHQEEQVYQPTLTGMERYLKPQQLQLLDEWEQAADREKRSRTMFAQHRIKVDEVLRELQAARTAVGSGVALPDFLIRAIRHYGGQARPNGAMHIDLRETPRALQELVGQNQFKAKFQLPMPDNTLYLTRTHPYVEAIATFVMNHALDSDNTTAVDNSDPQDSKRPRRAGVIRTHDVAVRTTLLLTRLRYHLVTIAEGQENQLLAEDSLLLAFQGAPDQAHWLDEAQAEALLSATPAGTMGNISHAEATSFLHPILAAYDDHLRPYLAEMAQARGEALLNAHRRVRSESHQRGVRYRVEPQLPVDVLGIYIFLPVANLF